MIVRVVVLASLFYLAATVAAVKVANGDIEISFLAPAAAQEEAPTGPKADVGMVASKYDPVTFQAAVGQKVTWRNDDPFAHTVTPTDKALWGSEGSGDAQEDWMEQGDTWSFTFEKPGEYVYYCILHAFKGKDGVYRGQVGTILVR